MEETVIDERCEECGHGPCQCVLIRIADALEAILAIMKKIEEE
jgi:hypothetical protein